MDVKKKYVLTVNSWLRFFQGLGPQSSDSKTDSGPDSDVNEQGLTASGRDFTLV